MLGLTLVTAPEIKQVRARNLIPYRYALWCTVEGRESGPFANLIVLREWTKDNKIRFMLDTHNFYYSDPEELVSVVEVPLGHSEEFQREIEALDAKKMNIEKSVWDLLE